MDVRAIQRSSAERSESALEERERRHRALGWKEEEVWIEGKMEVIKILGRKSEAKPNSESKREQNISMPSRITISI